MPFWESEICSLRMRVECSFMKSDICSQSVRMPFKMSSSSGVSRLTLKQDEA